MATQYTAGLTTGQVLTAATMNSIGAAWESYTPTIKQGATTVTATINYAKYAQINKIVIVQIALALTSAGAANGIITVTYPSGLTPANSSGYRPLGNIIIHDTGVALYHAAAVVYDTTTFSGMSYNCVSFVGQSAPAFTIANGDRFDAQLMYEVA
jgi:pyruvate kinase